jgi:predicted DsbA family dithiol-disulfide isomerase
LAATGGLREFGVWWTLTGGRRFPHQSNHFPTVLIMAESSSTPRIRIDIWSDYVCPFCYLQMPALRRLKEEFGPALDVVWHAFELRPEPRPTLDPAGEYLRTTWERSVYPMARERGMNLKLPPVQPRSRKAMEAVAHAHSQGRSDAMHEAMFRAFFEEGQDIGQTDVLLDIGESVGLQRDALRKALEENAFAAQVTEDQRLARDFGISGVPVMVLREAGAPWQEAVALQGAVPYESMRAAVGQLIADTAKQAGK